nr:hypothetical protein [Ktedonobacteraceae bacterium]
MTIETGRTTIRQLRATSSDRDPFAYQLRLGSMLSSADLHPPGVSASAIICIRTLHAPPLPTQALRYGGGRPPLWWEERVRTLIKHALQQASHPLHDTVPPDCEAVIFADRAELLACLASDWCATGDTSDRWWWQSLFRAGAIEQYLIPAWLETPEYIPSALLHLASARKVTAFVRRLPANDVRTLLHSIIRSFALPELQTVLAAAFSAQPFSAATLLQEHEHAPATSETSNTSDTSDTSVTIDTLEIAETSETTETSSATNLPDGYGLFDKQGSVEADVSHPTIMKLSEGEKPLRRGGSGVDVGGGPLWSPVDGAWEPMPSPTQAPAWGAGNNQPGLLANTSSL